MEIAAGTGTNAPELVTLLLCRVRMRQGMGLSGRLHRDSAVAAIDPSQRSHGMFGNAGLGNLSEHHLKHVILFSCSNAKRISRRTGRCWSAHQRVGHARVTLGRPGDIFGAAVEHGRVALCAWAGEQGTSCLLGAGSRYSILEVCDAEKGSGCEGAGQEGT